MRGHSTEHNHKQHMQVQDRTTLGHRLYEKQFVSDSPVFLRFLKKFASDSPVFLRILKIFTAISCLTHTQLGIEQHVVLHLCTMTS